jgi:peptidoglycan/LPS O-acetylase OafA/YrhL
MNSGTSDFLNASRWTAAFFVVFYHVYNLSIASHQASMPFALFFRALHFFGGFGHIAVIVFFVISGFLIGGRTILNLHVRGFNLTDYFVHRFSRIYTVFIPALAIGYLIDWCGAQFFDASRIYNYPDQFYTNAFGNDISTHLSLNTFVGNLLQLQSITVSVLGSNGPLWSLANEWWYYVLFGCGVIVYRAGPVSSRVIAGVIILTMIFVLPLTVSLWFTIWVLGAGVAVMDRYWRGWPFFYGATIAVICLAAVRFITAREVSTGIVSDFTQDLVVALGFSAALLCAKNSRRLGKFRTFHRDFASFSYTVYLVHFPVMVFLAAMMKDVLHIGFLRQPSVGALAYATALLLIIYGYARVFAALTEAHTDTIRSRLSLFASALRHRAISMAHARLGSASAPGFEPGIKAALGRPPSPR